MLFPLNSSWTLAGDALPERLLPNETPAAFRLPGADALSAFADLIGDTPEETPPNSAPDGAPFTLPALLPEDVTGEATLSREVDFGDLGGDMALLSFDMLCGRGSVTLESLPPRFTRPGTPAAEAITLTCDFDNAPVTLNVTSALRAHRRFLVALRFGDARPAGACGPILLRTADSAYIDELTVTPEAASGTLLLGVRVTAQEEGDYRLRAVLCPAEAPGSPEEAPPARELNLRLQDGETKTVQITMAADLPAFVPGKPYAAPGVKVFLHKAAASGSGKLCDSATRMCGFLGALPAYYLPLGESDLRLPPEQLMETLNTLHVPGVLLPAAAPDMLYRLLTRAGISALHSAGIAPDVKARLLRYPCAAFERSLFPTDSQADPILSAWQLCGLITYPRAADADMLPAELLADAAGRELDPLSEDTQAVLAWLRALSVRLRAEAMRQGKLRGALCTPGEAHQPDVAQAIGTALAPTHLSALPLCGAWWTGSRFSASLQAFIPRDVLSVDKSIRAVASLEDADGRVVARTEFPCAPWRSGLGLLETTLPDAPCVLELVTRLYADEDVLEESTMPVYVGERGALEAAF